MKIFHIATLLFGFYLLPNCSVLAQFEIDEPHIQPTWKFKQSSNPFHTAPIIFNDQIIALPKNGDIASIDLNNGKELWSKNHKQGVWERSLSTGVVNLYYGTKDKKLCAVKAKTGSEVWCITLPKNIQRAPLEHNQHLYVVTAELGPGLKGDKAKSGSIYSINIETGDIVWRKKTKNYAMQSPIVKDTTLYVAGSYDDPSVDIDEGGPVSIMALDISQGQTKWEFSSEDGFIKALYATEDFLAFVGYQDFISVLDANTGKFLWKRDSGNWVPAISGYEDTIYYGSANTKVHAWNISDGETLWEFNINNGSFNYALDAPIKIGNNLFFLSQRGGLIVLNAKTGALIAHHQTGLVAHIGLVTDGTWVVVGDSKGVIYAYNMSKML